MMLALLGERMLDCELCFERIDDGRDSLELLRLNMFRSVAGESPFSAKESWWTKSASKGVKSERRYSVESGRWKNTVQTFKVMESPIKNSSMFFRPEISAAMIALMNFSR